MLESRCSTIEEVVRYLSMLGLRNTAVKRRIEALVRQGLVETAKTLVCAKKDLRTALVVAGNDWSTSKLYLSPASLFTTRESLWAEESPLVRGLLRGLPETLHSSSSTSQLSELISASITITEPRPFLSST